jgi:hypothetical protein
VPDWTYHPAYRPLVFRLPAEDARRLTMWLLSVMGRTRAGRELFRMLSYGLGTDPVDLWGLRFASRYGLGPDIDAEAAALPVLQYLGCGFLTAGPVATGGRARVRRRDRQRMPGCHGLTRPSACCAPTPETVAANLRRRNVIKVPVAAVIDDEEPQEAIRLLESTIDFFSIRGSTPQRLAAARAATSKPLLLRVPLEADVRAAIEAATVAKLDGVVLGDGVAFAGMPDTTIDSRHALPVVLEQLRAARERFGRDLRIVASGGVMTPEDARACVAAGADLVEVDTGFVYSGPGLIARALEEPAAPEPVEARGALSADASRLGARIIATWAVVGIVVAARLPPSALAVVATLAALAAGLASLARRGDAWTSWGFAAVGAATLPIDPWLAAGGLVALIAVEPRLGWLRTGFRPLFATRLNAWRWSAASLGRFAIQCAAVAAAAAIVALPLAADVRLAALATCGVLLVLVTRGLRPGARPVWASLLGGVAGTAILAFVFHGTWWQRALAGAAAALGGMGLAWLWKPLVELDEDAPRFPDV